MKRTDRLTLLLCAVFVMNLATSCDSYKKRMAKCEKAATEYKTALGEDALVLAEVIDSIAQEIVYIRWVGPNDPWDFVDCKKDNKHGIVEVHNYVTGITENLFSNWSRKTEYRFFQDGRLIKDRLFMNFWDGRYGTALLYVNIRDNSIHEVAFPEKAEISDSRIVLTEMYLVHDSDFEYAKEYGRKKYIIMPDLTDAEYVATTQIRKEDLQNTERKAEEENERHRKIAKKEKKNCFCILNYLDGLDGGLQLRMTGLVGNVSAAFDYDDYNDGYLNFISNDEIIESWGAKLVSVNGESGRMIISLEAGAKGELIGYLQGEMGNAIYEGRYIDPSGNETPFSFFDGFQNWGF